MGCRRDPKILESTKPWDITHEELHTVSRTSLTKRGMLQPAKLRGYPFEIKSLIQDKELQGLSPLATGEKHTH